MRANPWMPHPQYPTVSGLYSLQDGNGTILGYAREAEGNGLRVWTGTAIDTVYSLSEARTWLNEQVR